MKVGLVLSGGGARGIAHLGVIKALEEHGVTIDFLAGTSAGSIVGALYAYGYSPEEILSFTKDTSVLKHLRPALNLTGLIKMEGFEELLEKYLPEDSFECLKIPLTIATTDINQGTTRYFESGPLIKPILASSCIPVIFSHVTIDGVDYVDGGITNNFPLEPIESQCDFLIGSHTNYIGSDFTDFNMKSLLERTMLIAISGNVYPKKDRCDLFLDPPGLSIFAGFDIRRSEEIYKIGYRYAQQYLASVPRLLERLVSTN